ncbi:MAG TPA: SufE family protein, partial [Actinomycetota bacterium]
VEVVRGREHLLGGGAVETRGQDPGEAPGGRCLRGGDDHRVHLWFDAPPEAPTTRGFAGILSSGLNGATPEEVLATPDDFYDAMGLSEIISALRLRGMAAILFRLKRQVRTALEAESA